MVWASLLSLFCPTSSSFMWSGSGSCWSKPGVQGSPSLTVNICWTSAGNSEPSWTILSSRSIVKCTLTCWFKSGQLLVSQLRVHLTIEVEPLGHMTKAIALYLKKIRITGRKWMQGWNINIYLSMCVRYMTPCLYETEFEHFKIPLINIFLILWVLGSFKSISLILS